MPPKNVPSEEEGQCFVAYPFGKLLPIMSKIKNFISIKRHNWVYNWTNAVNNFDHQSVFALIMVLNEWRRNQLFYNVPKSELKIHAKDHYAIHISHVLSLLNNKHNNSNQMVAQTIVQFLRFYYMSFKDVKSFIQFSDIILQMINSTQKYLVHFNVIDNKDDLQQFIDFPQTVIIIRDLGHLMDFLGYYDGIGPKVQKQSNPSPKSHSEARCVIKQLIEDKCMSQLLSTLVHIKIDLLIFFKVHHKEQWEKLKITRQVQKRVKQISNEDEISLPLGYLRNIARTITKTETNSRICFAYINPFLRYLPYLIVNSGSEKQQAFVFQMIFLPIVKSLKKKVYEENNQHSFFISYKYASKFSERDLILAFIDTSFLNNLEICLVAYFEQKIQQHKQVEGYERQYLEIQSYFNILSDLKKKVVKALETISEELKTQFVFNKSNQPNRSQIPKKQLQKQNLQSKTNQKDSKAGKKPDSYEKLDHKKGSQKQAINQKTKMPKIQQENISAQEDTDAGQELIPLRHIKMQQQKQKKPQKSKHKINEDRNADEQSQSIGLKPLYNKHQSRNQNVQSLSSVFKRKQQKSQSRQAAPRGNEIGGQFLSSEDKITLIIRPQYFLTYYQHQSNTFNARKIFKQHHTQYKLPDMNSPQKFFMHHSYQYPSFINRNIFDIPKIHNFQSKYDQAKFDKNILYSGSNIHKGRMKQALLCHLKLSRQKQIYYNKKRKSNNQTDQTKATADRNEYIETLKRLKLPKKQNLQFYYQNLRPAELRITLVTVTMYPLLTTPYGQVSLSQLTIIIQHFLALLLKQKPNHSESQINIFNKKLRNFQTMINLNKIQTFGLHKTHELLITILCQIMLILNQSQNLFDFFYQNFYKKLPVYMQSMITFYIYEIQTHYGTHFNDTFTRFIQTQDLVNLLKFLIKDSKLNSVQMKKMYQNLYIDLSQKCSQSIVMLEELLCQQIIPLALFQKQRSERRNSLKQINRRLQSLKRQFYESWERMIDLVNIWLCLSYSSVSKEGNLPSDMGLPMQKMELIYFCNQCKNPQSVDFSTKNIANYQSYICEFCQIGVLDRFELNSFKLRGLSLDMIGDMMTDIKGSIQNIKSTVSVLDDHMERMPLYKYKEDAQRGSQKMLGPYQGEDKVRNKKDRHKKQPKNDQEYIQESNEQFCYNSGKILVCYYEDLAELIQEAFPF